MRWIIMVDIAEDDNGYQTRDLYLGKRLSSCQEEIKGVELLAVSLLFYVFRDLGEGFRELLSITM